MVTHNVQFRFHPVDQYNMLSALSAVMMHCYNSSYSRVHAVLLYRVELELVIVSHHMLLSALMQSVVPGAATRR